MGSTFAPRFVITSDTAYLDGTFETLGITHDLTIGSAGYRVSSYSLINAPAAARLRLGKRNHRFTHAISLSRGRCGGFECELRFFRHLPARPSMSAIRCTSISTGVPDGALARTGFHVNNFNNKGGAHHGVRQPWRESDR